MIEEHNAYRLRSIQNNANSNDFAELVKTVKKNANLDENQKERVLSVLMQHESAFSKIKGDIGCSKIVKHEICTLPKPPVHVPMRRIPMHLEEQVDNHVEDLLNKNIIRKSTSPWNAALVVVPKKDGTRWYKNVR